MTLEIPLRRRASHCHIGSPGPQTSPIHLPTAAICTRVERGACLRYGRIACARNVEGWRTALLRGAVGGSLAARAGLRRRGRRGAARMGCPHDAGPLVRRRHLAVRLWIWLGEPAAGRISCSGRPPRQRLAPCSRTPADQQAGGAWPIQAASQSIDVCQAAAVAAQGMLNLAAFVASHRSPAFEADHDRAALHWPEAFD